MDLINGPVCTTNYQNQKLLLNPKNLLKSSNGAISFIYFYHCFIVVKRMSRNTLCIVQSADYNENELENCQLCL